MTHKPQPKQPETAASERGPMAAQKRPFWRDESGAISVDWVVLCAAMVGLVGTTFASLSPVVMARIATMLP